MPKIVSTIEKEYRNLLAAQTHKIKWMIQAMAPVDTGMLQRDVRVHRVSDVHIECIVGDSTEYMPYTEEKWINRPGTNPNEGWFGASADNVARFLAISMNGRLSTPYESPISPQNIESNETIDRVMAANSRDEAL